ncbi:hypothetical protein [Gluconobacter sp. Gdi]|uniref:hypothetical protein n=1 Tax=Gluconobacter sp. Gdi TaxID=2691888 RepID=UPI00176128C5|nr:hypothetical protein [Gluconobacter sp. Gdi]GFE95786.1 hypothetical protein DmGdi_08590 [Gluconobacter sp. Gdi]
MISTRKKFVLQAGVMAAAIFFGSTTNAAELKQADTEKNASKEKPKVEKLTVLGYAECIAPATVSLDITQPTSKIRSGFFSK